ncbi:MAG: efflux RND transporter periplasmic adaptor subunit [Rhodospirillaceae bacterium]|nr:efflux RND transporter periplasmic adaptor subunit [Rhodospirillales bacterium]
MIRQTLVILFLACPFLAGPAWAQSAPPPMRAQLSPRQFTTLSSELPGKVDRITVRDGEAFKKGEMLVEMDCVLQRAQLEKARASLGAAEKTLAVNQRLAEMKSVGALEVQLSAAEVAKARADVSFMSATVAKCSVSAPFAGRVVERKAQSHQYIAAGQPLLDILDDRSLEIESAPELVSPGRRRFMIVFALAIWVYRVVLFLGIALLVYHAFFKVLGLFLMAVEIGWFILRPVGVELMEVWKRRAALQPNRRLARTIAVVVAAIAAVAIPWQTSVEAPGVLRPRDLARVFAEAPSRIDAVLVSVGESVTAGQTLMRLASPELEFQHTALGARARAQEWALANQSFDDEVRAGAIRYWNRNGAPPWRA